MTTNTISIAETRTTEAPRMWPQLATIALCTAAALSILLIPMDVTPATQRALAVTAWMILLWVSSPLDPSIVGLAGCFLYWATGAADFETAFGGFSRESSWFVLAAIILGLAAVETGLARRLAHAAMSVIETSYSRILMAIVTVSFLLTFIVPSASARVVVVALVCLGIVEAFAVAPKSNISRGLFAILTCSTILFDNIRPLAGLPLIVACWLAVLWLYPAETQARTETPKPDRLTGREKRAFVIIATLFVLWSTEFIHHISPSMVGIGAALGMYLPRIGIFDSEDFVRINPLPILLAGAVVSMAIVLEATRSLPGPVQPLLYQLPVLVVGYSYGQFETRDLLKVGLPLAVVGLFIP